MHDGLGLAMDEDLHLPGQPLGGGDGLDQRGVVAGSLLADRIGAPAPVDPGELHAVRRGQGENVVRSGNFDEGFADRAGRQRFQGSADRGQARLVTGEQMPVGGRVGRIRAAGAHQMHRVAGLCRQRPRAGHAVLAVDDEVDGDLPGRGIGAAHRVGAHRRLMFRR